MKYTGRRRAEEILNNIKGKKVAVVGDLMLDVYVWGKVSRISPEAPVPVVHVNRTSHCLGGAANVMRNIVSLGGKALAYGIIGTGENGEKLRQLMYEDSIETEDIISDPAYTTIEKQRIIADSQQLARVDYEDKGTVTKNHREIITERLISGIKADRIDGIIFEDYAKGLLDSNMVNEVIKEAKKKNLPVSLDPHPSHKMNTEGLTLMTPNHIEAFALAGIYLKDLTDPVDKDISVRGVAEKIKDEWNIEQLLITLGPRGMLLFDKGSAPVHIPTVAKEVFDVTGAGDTVIAVNTMGLLGGASAKEAAEISNYAAGIVVAHIGTTSVKKEDILSQFI
ncbi:MAG: hypothetical protein K9M56_03490 [Victivallales bacterium]|nr:hypothetical protein [Victivallales bacterium]